LTLARAQLADLGASPEQVAAADERAAEIVRAAVAQAKAAPGPDPAAALTDVWADGGSSWRT
jgi:pyruvate dehydrogenase E1 component alpha subunit